MWYFLTMWSLQNLPFNLARTLLAVFLISAIKSSSSCLTSGTNECRLLMHTLTKLEQVPDFEQQFLKDLHYSFRRHRQNKVTSWLTLLVHIQKILILETGCLDLGFCCFPQSIQVKVETALIIGHKGFLPHLFQNDYSYIIYHSVLQNLNWTHHYINKE